MSSTPYSFRQRRRGQALLLAVLIMIFAALLSASFIAVVSVNLNQSARQTDKNRSVVAARAGLDYVRNRLAYSGDGDRWRTELENVPPAPGDPDYNFYYTPMDIAQGWARTTPHPTGMTGDLDKDGNYYDGSNPATIDPGDERIALATTRQVTHKLELVKSPDPRITGGQIGDASTFLSQVESVGAVTNTADPDYGKTGALKITVIGLSNEDPTAYTRTVAYFGGYQNAPVARTMRVVSNWDFTRTGSAPNGQALVAQANPAAGSDGTGATPSFPLSNTKGDFSTLAVPFTITISNPRNGTPARSAVVTTATNALLTLAAPLTTAVGAGDRVELAANLGAPVGIDYDNSGTPTPLLNTTTPALDLRARLSDGALSATTPNYVDGARINNGLVVSGNLYATKLRAAATGFSTGTAPGGIFVSGVIAPENPTVSKLNIADVNGGNVDTVVPSQPATGSSDGLFASPPSTTSSDKFQLVNDGWNGLQGKGNGDGTGLRNVRDFQPPVIDSGPSVDRYRSLTRTSKPLAGLPASASLYGGGEGIYIDNYSDYEKVGSATGPIVRMGQSDFVKMLMSPPNATGSYVRAPLPATPIQASNLATYSLEDQHLRGWVGPDEFRGRGAEVELTDDYDGDATNGLQPGLIITRDSRTDNTAAVTTNALGPDPAKSWKDRFGTLRSGVYRQGFPWPTNGVVFAEGNVRIKGQVTNVPRSLTVVSMNNIYIEDSLSAASATGAARKILLLARMNVVMNPTRAIGRPDAQTIVQAAAPTAVVNTTVTLNVADTGNFRAGDIVETADVLTPAGEVDSIGRITTAPTATSVDVKVLYSRLGSIGINSALRTRFDSTATVTGGPSFSKIGTLKDAVQRRFNLDPSTTNPAVVSPSTRIDFVHEGSRTPLINGAPVATAIFNVKTIKPTVAGYTKSTTDTIFLSNKRVLDAGVYNATAQAATTESDVDKLIRGEYSGPPMAGADTFPSTPPADDTAANLFDLTALQTAMNGAPPHLDPGPPQVGWQYQTTSNPLYPAVPFFYLSSIGNRLDFADGSYPSTPSTERRKEILNSTTGYDVPLATSIGLYLNGVVPSISDDVSSVAKTTQFGFNPNYQDVTATKPPEDILTTDESFYQPNTAVGLKNVTLDSRTLSGLVVGVNSLNMRQSEGLTGITDATNPLPDYRLLGMRIEDVDLATNVMKTGRTFKVDAFVYAQRGSWFVIPGAPLESRVRGDGKKSFYDADGSGGSTPNDPSEYIDADGSGTYNDGDAADLNRNGKVDPGEIIAGLRFNTRYNYTINFTGSIAENQTALVNDVGTTKGEVASWMDRWATTSADPSVTATPVTRGRITYTFDPTVVLNGFEATDEGFRLPYTPDVFNVS